MEPCSANLQAKQEASEVHYIANKFISVHLQTRTADITLSQKHLAGSQGLIVQTPDLKGEFLEGDRKIQCVLIEA